MLRSMARRMSGADSHTSGLERCAVAPHVGALERIPGVSPLALALTGKVQRCTGRRREIVRSRQEIGVDVRFRHVRDADAIGPGGAGVQPDVGIRIDDDRLASFFAGDEITRLRQILVVESSEKH